MEGEVLRVCITGAAGQIGYSLIPLIASGQAFGPDQRIELHLLDIPIAEQSLRGVVMEIEDGAYPLVSKVVAGTDPMEIFKGIHWGIFVGGFPRKAGMERKELISKNCSIFKEQGRALNEVADPNVKCLVVANPANTNCFILSQNAPKIPKENFTAMTRLDHNRARTQLAVRADVPVSSVKNAIIWGNHSATQYPNVNNGTINGKPIREVISDDEWLNGPFITTVQKRGAAIIEARKLSSAMSAANAAKDHVRDWFLGTKEGEWVSMGVLSNGNPYGIAEDIVYSFPCTCANGTWSIVPGLEVDDFSKEKMDITLHELAAEKKDAEEALKA